MPGFVLTGTPGAGKTAILRALEREGHRVVEEAATDVIALEQALGWPEPERDPRFLEKIVGLQRARQLASPADSRAPVFFDRSPVCTLALARYAGLTVPAALAAEVERVLTGLRAERVLRAESGVRDPDRGPPDRLRRFAPVRARARAGVRGARLPAHGGAARTSGRPGRADRCRRRPARAAAGRVTFRRVCRR